MSEERQAEARPSRGLRWALASHPTRQLVSFATKTALAFFLAPDELGAAMLAGSLVFGVSHLALLGLDEALVHSRQPGPALWRHLRRCHHVSGGLLAVATVGAGFAVGGLTGDASLGRLLSALGPMVWLANQSVLPTALLTRAEAYRALFLVDLAGVLAFSAATLTAAALGTGPWCLVAGWYANAVAQVATASRVSRPWIPAGPDGDDIGKTVRFGRHLAGADMADFVGQRLDGWTVGFGLGRAALGLYEWAQHLGGHFVQYAASLSERSLFPILAREHRRRALAPAFHEAIRLVVLYLLPLHVVLATAAWPILALFPDRWQDAAPLLVLVCAAAAARCVDLVGTTALKAGDLSRSVAGLGLVRVAVLVVALVISLRLGLIALVAGVVAARAVSAAIAVWAARARLGLRGDGRLRPAVWTCAAWTIVYTVPAVLLQRVLAPTPLATLAVLAALAPGSWLLVRLALDRPRLSVEWARLVQRTSGGGR